MNTLTKVVYNDFPTGDSETPVISVGKIIPRQLIVKHKPIAGGTDYKIYIKRDLESAYELPALITSDTDGAISSTYNFPDGLTYTFLQFKMVTANDVTADEPELVFIYQPADFEGIAKRTDLPLVTVDLTGLITPVNVTGGFVMKGTFDIDTNYEIGDFVEYNGTSYVMYVDGPVGTLPTDTDYWQLVASVGPSGPGITDDAVGFHYTGGTSPKTLTVPDDANVSGTNTGDETQDTIEATLGIGKFDRIAVIHFNADPDDLTTGDGKMTWIVPSELNGYNITNAQIALAIASTSGLPTFQINNLDYSGGAQDILSTKVSIDINELTSYTSETPAVINTTYDNVATANRLRIDCDIAGTGAKGGTLYLTLKETTMIDKTFKAKIIDGVPTIKPFIERTKNKNGGYDITVHMPTLELINKFKDEQERKQNG